MLKHFTNIVTLWCSIFKTLNAQIFLSHLFDYISNNSVKCTIKLCVYIYIYICICVCVYVFIYVCICIYICVYIIYIYIYICMYVCMYVCVYMKSLFEKRITPFLTIFKNHVFSLCPPIILN